MAYHVGAIVYEHWGYEPVSVSLLPEVAPHRIWEYRVPFQKLDVDALPKLAARKDLLIANPSFSDQLFGLRFPGKKLMYVQGVSTYPVIDGFFDKYVAVSPFVQQFIRDIYGLRASIIPPFIHHDHAPDPLRPWEERPEGSVVTILKWAGRPLLERFEAILRERHPSLRCFITVIPPNTPHRQVLQIFAQHRYFLCLSPVEGFGLPPLEAMLCGCAVAGFHGLGGEAYLEHNRNALVCSYPDLEKVVTLFCTLVATPALARNLILSGKQTASRYTFESFRERWIDELTFFLERPIGS